MAQKAKGDSAAIARQKILEATRERQKRSLDSAKASRQQRTDSIKIVRERRTDSMERIRKYRESRKFTDSVARVRKVRLDSIQNFRKVKLDSLTGARKRITDSTVASRKIKTDSIKVVQKRRTDSLGRVRKYRESKRFTDSTNVVRKQRLDSVKLVRKVFSDSATASRKRINDSATASRKQRMDSTTAARTKFMDSTKAARKVRTDSLAKLKVKREKDQEVKQKQKTDKMQLALELKIKKKREAYSNDKMLKKKWGVPRQIVQNTFTRYNYYFNTDRKMDEALENMQRMKKEDYDALLPLFPFDPDVDSASLSADMDSIIQKASLGIQIHDPRTKWGDDLYLLLGQAYYYKGDYDNASTAFRYILSLADKRKKKKSGGSSRPVVKKGVAPSIAQKEKNGALDFVKHRSVHNESLLWLARTYTEWHQDGNAESVLDLLGTDVNFPESLKGRYALEKAYLNLSQQDYKNASENLTIVTADKSLPDWVRRRAGFLNGQLLQERGDYTASAQSFEKVIDLQPKIDMEFYARRNMANSLVMAGGNQEATVASLKRVLNDGKYAPYYEQVYYLLGRLAANGGNNDDAVTYLQKGLTSSKTTKKQKALSYATLGNVYYSMHNYRGAKLAYDSASYVASAAPGDSLIEVAVRRAMVLGNITGPSDVIQVQDSLLGLASLSQKDQYLAIRRHIRFLENQRNDSIFRAENAGINNAMQNANDQQVGDNKFANWYFANPTLMQQGLNEFKRKWGTRTLGDNWRRSAASGFVSSGAAGGATAAGGDGDNVELDANGLPTEESLMAYIPNGQNRKDDALKNIRRAYVDLGNAYIKELEDYEQAKTTLDSLDARFPMHEHKAEVTYLRYLSALKQNKLAEAKPYSDKLLAQYADTRWAKLVQPTEDGAGQLNTSVNASVYYNETYELVLQRQYANALERIKAGRAVYKDPAYQKRFTIVEAIAQAGVNDFDRADTLVTGFIKQYPADSLRRWADAVADYIKRNRPAAPPPAAVASAADGAVAAAKDTTGAAVNTAAATGSKPAVVDLRERSVTSVDDTAEVTKLPIPIATMPANPPEKYVYKPQSDHYVIVSFPKAEARAMGVKAAMGDFNTFKFGSLGLTTEAEMINPGQGVIIIKTFDGVGRAKIYMNTLRGTAQVFREYKASEYEIFMISTENYQKMVADKGIQAYLNFYKANYK